MLKHWMTCSTAVLLASGNALGSPLFELVGDTSGQGGFNARSTGAGAASTYFNPALLADSPQEFNLGLFVLSDQISMILDGRPAGDVPLVVGDRTALDPRTHQPIPNDTVPTQWLQNGCTPATCNGASFAARPRQSAGSSGVTRTYTSIGLVSHVFDPWVVLGVHALVPNGNFTQMDSFHNDEREQFFSNSLHPELYSDRLTSPSLAFGAGGHITRRLAVGVSFSLSIANSAAAATYVPDPVDYSKLLLDNKVAVTTAVTPDAGITFTPIDRLRLSATFHAVQKIVLKTGISATLPAGNQSQVTLTEVHDYVPWIAAIGGDLDLNPGSEHLVSVTWTAQYEAWSHYLDRHGQHPDVYGSAFAWKDVVTGSVGVRYSHRKSRSYLDFTVHPSPVPLQTGRSNYVDNDRVGASIGTDYEFQIFNHPLRIGVTAQAHALIYRYQAKQNDLIIDEFPDGSVDKNLAPIPGSRGLQTNNPGWPGFASEGWIFGGNLYASLVY